MHSNWIKIAGVVALGLVIGVWVRGYTDGKGWTSNNG